MLWLRQRDNPFNQAIPYTNEPIFFRFPICCLQLTMVVDEVFAIRCAAHAASTGAVSGAGCPQLCRRLPSWATRQVAGYLGYTGRTANVVATSDAFTWPHATRLQSAWHPRNREALGRFL